MTQAGTIVETDSTHSLEKESVKGLIIDGFEGSENRFLMFWP